MNTSITLDEHHFKTAAEEARKLGTTPEAYVQSLIDAATTAFDDLAAPFQESFSRSGATEDELDAAITEARRALKHKPENR